MKNKIYIFGCGISGMLTAIALAQENIETIIAEIKSETEIACPVDPRTTAVSHASKQFMQKIKVWENLAPFCEDIKDIYVCQRMSDHILHMEAKDQELGIMITNMDLRRELYKLTKTIPQIKIHFNAKYHNLVPTLKEVKFDLTLEDKTLNLSADLCIAADGRFSEAKKQFFNNKMAKDYNQKAIVFNIEHSKNHEGGAIEHFLYRGPFATLPLKDGFKSSIVWSENTEIAEFLIKQNNETLEKLMINFIGNALGNIKIITPPQSYPLSAFITEKYFEGRLVLLADSAHGMHPLAGQGLNMGIKDVESLSSLIIKNIDLGLSIDEILLSKYQKLRTRDNIAMVKITDTINTIFNSQIKPLNKVTEVGLSLLNSMPFIKNSLIDYAKGKR